MGLFSIKRFIPIEFNELTLEKILNFPRKKNASSEGYYINEIYNENHVQIAVTSSRVYTSGIHDFIYDDQKSYIEIYSRYRKSAFLLYGYLTMGIFPLLSAKNELEVILKVVGLIVLLFILLSAVLVFGIRSEQKELQRELNIRINFYRRNMIN